MLKSMTGYGRAQQTVGEWEIQVEIKSVNHRYFEFSARTPRAYGYLDERLKGLVGEKVSRGKLETGVTLFRTEGRDAEVEVNLGLARSYVEALRGAAPELGLRDDLELSALLRFADVFQVKKAVEDEEEIWSAVRSVAEQALARFVQARQEEGERMQADISARLDQIEKQVSEVELRSPQTVAVYRERLKAKLDEVLEGRGLDEARILTEAAIFADKIAVDEETVRLRSHLTQFRGLLDSSEPVGRKLDFLVQEMNREVNTTGSKCSDVEITNRVLEMKAELEKIREQIQNIE